MKKPFPPPNTQKTLRNGVKIIKQARIQPSFSILHLKVPLKSLNKAEIAFHLQNKGCLHSKNLPLVRVERGRGLVNDKLLRSLRNWMSLRRLPVRCRFSQERIGLFSFAAPCSPRTDGICCFCALFYASCLF